LYDSITREEAFGKDVEAVALYFSAHWCGPCRSFTPKLIEAYNKINKDKKRFEVVFCSADRDQKAYDDYFGTHPWLSIPFADKKREGALSSHFDCDGIPHLVILDPKNNFEVINGNAVGKVYGDEEGKDFPWAPDMVKHIDSDPEGIDEGLSLVVLQESVNSKVQEENLEKILKPIAEKYKGKKLNDSEILFFVANKEGHLAYRVRDACSVDKEGDKNKPQVVMMNIPDDSYYAFDSEELNMETIEKFFESYKAGSLSTKPMGA
jgi:nucleoredoxin